MMQLFVHFSSEGNRVRFSHGIDTCVVTWLVTLNDGGHKLAAVVWDLMLVACDTFCTEVEQREDRVPF